MKMITTTIYPAFPSIPLEPSSPSSTPSMTTPSQILAISGNPVLFGSIFQQINSNGPCSSCGHGK